MTKTRFDLIYKDLKQKIEKKVYDFQSLLPSENEMSEIYGCSRNTYRRAISMLAKDGYVQAVHGKGVIVLYQPQHTTTFSIGGIESFHESALRNHLKVHTEVKKFTEIVADEHIAANSGFPVGAELYYIQRVRYLDDKPVILDINLFLKSVVCGLIKLPGEFTWMEKKRTSPTRNLIYLPSWRRIPTTFSPKKNCSEKSGEWNPSVILQL